MQSVRLTAVNYIESLAKSVEYLVCMVCSFFEDAQVFAI